VARFFSTPYLVMDIESTMEANKGGVFVDWRNSIKALPRNMKSMVINFTRSITKIGKDDPRRVYHSLKVAFALTLVSLFYYSRPLYDGFGVAGMWAVLTVVVVFEFSVGEWRHHRIMHKHTLMYISHYYIINGLSLKEFKD